MNDKEYEEAWQPKNVTRTHVTFDDWAERQGFSATYKHAVRPIWTAAMDEAKQRVLALPTRPVMAEYMGTTKALINCDPQFVAEQMK